MDFVRKMQQDILATIILPALLLLSSYSVSTTPIANNGFEFTNLVYAQTSQAEKEIDIYKIPIKKVRVNDIDVAYKRIGNDSNVIVLISGGSNTMNFWDPHMIKELSKDNTILVFDSRGIGNTTSGSKPFSIKQFANDTVGLLDALRINNKADILGFSLGSLVAQEIAYMHPERVN